MGEDYLNAYIKRKIGHKKFERLNSYRSRVRKFCAGIFIGVGLIVAGAKLDKEALEYIGYGVGFATSIVAQAYKNKADRLEDKIDEQMDIIMKGGVIDDKLI